MRIGIRKKYKWRFGNRHTPILYTLKSEANAYRQKLPL